MLSTVLARHDGLGGAGRLPAVSRPGAAISPGELSVLAVLGGATALAAAFLTRGLGIPGHNILRVVFPMALGLAVVPRRGAASVMGATSFAAAGVLTLGGVHGIGLGAMTSLLATGVLLDVALRGARTGRAIYLRLTLAALAANLLAMALRGGEKLLVGEPLGGVAVQGDHHLPAVRPGGGADQRGRVVPRRRPRSGGGVIYVGIDDTDVLGSPGTNKLARHLIHHLPAEYEPLVAIRHQLLFDPRVPYTSKNSSASLLFRSPASGKRERGGPDLAAAGADGRLVRRGERSGLVRDRTRARGGHGVRSCVASGRSFARRTPGGWPSGTRSTWRASAAPRTA